MYTVDDLQINGLKIFQNGQQFKFGSDAVRLANFVKKSKGIALDIGSGTGIIPILLAGKLGFEKVYGVELNEKVAQMSKLSVELNNLCGKIEIINCRIQDISNVLQAGCCSVITCNPPYNKVGSGEVSQNDSVAQARFEVSLTLEEVVKAAQYLLSTGAKFYIIHQIDRMAEVIHQCVKHNLMPKVVKLVDDKLFLCQCTKDGRVGLKILHEKSN